MNAKMLKWEGDYKSSLVWIWCTDYKYAIRTYSAAQADSM